MRPGKRDGALVGSAHFCARTSGLFACAWSWRTDCSTSHFSASRSTASRGPSNSCWDTPRLTARSATMALKSKMLRHSQRALRNHYPGCEHSQIATGNSIESLRDCAEPNADALARARALRPRFSFCFQNWRNAYDARKRLVLFARTNPQGDGCIRIGRFDQPVSHP